MKSKEMLEWRKLAFIEPSADGIELHIDFSTCLKFQHLSKCFHEKKKIGIDPRYLSSEVGTLRSYLFANFITWLQHAGIQTDDDMFEDNAAGKGKLIMIYGLFRLRLYYIGKFGFCSEITKQQVNFAIREVF